MTPKENANHFTELEKRSLLLDILIDCEEYDEFDKCALKCLGKSRKDDEKKSAAPSFDELCKMIKNKVNKINNDIEKEGGKLNVANYAEIIADFSPIQKSLRKRIRQEPMKITTKGRSDNSEEGNESNISRQYKNLTGMLMKGMPLLIQNELLDEYLKVIIISKYIRRLLKDTEILITPKISEEIYKNLTQILIIIVPQISDSEILNKSRIIFLNEISAVSEGYLSLGYAEMALSELRKLDANWKEITNGVTPIMHPYELYALYNKGLIQVHDHTPADAKKAMETFFEIIRSFEKDTGETSIEKLKEEYSINDEKDRLKISSVLFWLIYVPTKYILTEAYSDLNSSHNREQIIKKLFLSFKNLNKKYQISDDSDLTKKIEKYYKVKFIIQYMFSKIDSGTIYKNVIKIPNSVENACLEAFEKYWGKNKEDEPLKEPLRIIENKTFINEHSIIKNRLYAVNALYLLEYAKSVKQFNKYESLLKCVFDICSQQIMITATADWSDFAVTFLESVIFSLENHKKNKPWPECAGEKGQNKEKKKNSDCKTYWEINFQEIYETIFKKIKDSEWIPRKRELVEKLMKCQENILQQYENWEEEKGESKRNTYLKYQILLIEKILSDEDGRVFKKPWPESEKEKLVKNLTKTIGYKKLSDKFKKEKSSIHLDSDENEERQLKEAIESIEAKIKSNDSYTLPQDNDLEPVSKFIENKMNCDFYTRKLRLNTETFYDHLIYQSCRPSLDDHYVLTVLRRWQSFTPALSSGSEVGQKGGGYFVYKTNGKGEIEEGLVVDPGFNFLENFFGEGFSIRDINAILMTHSHPDHSNDFMSIMTLVHEMNKCGERVFADGKWEKRKLVLFMTEGCHQNFAEQINRKTDTFKDIIRVKQDDKEYDKKAFLKHFKLKVTKANHDDLTDYDSVGYVISNEKGEPLIGFTGDTQWYHGIEEKYKDCPVICMNIGGVVNIFKDENIMLSDLTQDKDKAYNNIKKILLRENHLYLPGFYLMAKKFNKKQKLLIISELCEEMKGGLRTDLAKKISGDIKIPILSEDIGLTVVLNNNNKNKKTGNVFCKICQSEHPPEEIVAVETDKDNAIIYLCHYHYNKLKEGSSLPKINELELDANELHNPLIKEDSAGLSPCLKKIIGK